MTGLAVAAGALILVVAVALDRSGHVDLSVPSDATDAATAAVTVTLGANRIQVLPGEAPGVSAALWREGELVASGVEPEAAGEAPVTLRLRAKGELVGEVIPGDRLVVTRAATTAWTIPSPRLAFDRVADQVSGQADWATSVRLAVRTPAGTLSAAELDLAAGGAFTHSFGHDLEGKQPFTSTWQTESGFALVEPRKVPFSVISTHPGDITGAVAPYSLVSVRLERDGEVVAEGQDWSDANGNFRTWLRDPSGRIIRARADDTVTVRDGEDSLSVSVPAVTGEYDLGATLHGRGIPGTEIRLVVWNPWIPDQYVTPTTPVDASGRWENTPDGGVHPGTHFYITQPLDHGDDIFHCEQIPVVHVDVGSPRVEIETLWDVRAALRLERGGEVVGRADGVATHSGRLSLLVEGGDRELVSIEPGDVLIADLNGYERQLTVPSITARLVDDQVVGSAAPGTTVHLGSRTNPQSAVDTDDQGRFVFDLPERVDAGNPVPGSLFQVYRETPAGDHGRVQFEGAAFVAEIGTRQVRLRGTAGTRVRLTRGDESVQALMGPEGWIDVLLDTPIAAGDTLAAQHLASGQVTRLTVPRLTGQLANGALEGFGPPGDVLQLAAYLSAAEEPERRHTVPDDDGRWRLELAEPGRASGRGPVDPRHVEVFELEWVSDDNRVIRRFPGPRFESRVFLPTT